MKRSIQIPALFVAAAVIGSATLASAASVWVNEFHYDNDGADVGEFIEIVVDTNVHTLSDLTVSLYNGSDDELYGFGSDTFNVSTDFTMGDSIGGGLVIYYKFITSSIQNGSPDGIAVSSSAGGGSLLNFISYEGVVGPAGDGPAVGATSTDIGVSETSSTPIGSSLGLTGIGAMGDDDGGDFTWSVISDDTPGSLNIGQTIPEPTGFVLVGLGGLALIPRRRR